MKSEKERENIFQPRYVWFHQMYDYYYGNAVLYVGHKARSEMSSIKCFRYQKPFGNEFALCTLNKITQYDIYMRNLNSPFAYDRQQAPHANA